MCGITGILDFNHHAVNKEILKRMNNVLVHRGPDDEGCVLINTSDNSFHELDRTEYSPGSYNLGLGHRRLSILDLSSLGHQPMKNDDGTIWITYNGEVYNYIELRSELQDRGYRFTSKTDTEIIIKAYEEWGEECLIKFNGMWAFVLWDARRKVIFAARDRFGVKPFYYYLQGQLFLFASEIKSILAHPAVPRQINEELIYDYLVLKMLDHSDQTMFKNIYQLKPSTCLVLKPDTREVTVRQWWKLNPNYSIADCTEKQIEEYSHKFQDLFQDAVKLRLRSDVAIGTCLSGGLDSSSIVVRANKLLFEDNVISPLLVGDSQKTFTSCFNDPRFDERAFSNEIVRVTGASNYQVFPGEIDLWNDLFQISWHMDEPFASTSQYSQWSVLRKASREGVTVLLNGQGGDEVLAGYRGYFSVYLANLLLSSKLRFMREFINTVHNGQNWVDLLARLGYLMAPGQFKISLRKSKFASHLFPEGASARVINKSFLEKYSERKSTIIENQANISLNLQQRLHDDLFVYSIPQLLRFEDRNSMAFSLETRLPFLDYRLVEFLFSIPTSLKIRNGWSKWLLRHSLREVLPPEVCWRKDKKGFVTPEVIWLKKLAPNIVDFFSSGKVLASEYGLLNKNVILENLADFLNRSDGIYRTEIWRWINLEVWLRLFFAGEADVMFSKEG